jgi:hypothetical protein
MIAGTVTENKFDQSFGTAGLNLGRSGPRGVEVLISALDHADARIRHAAVVGIDISRDSRAEALLNVCKMIRMQGSATCGNPNG